MLAYQDGLTSFAESQIKTARDTYTLLAKTMTSLKQMDIWAPPSENVPSGYLDSEGPDQTVQMRSLIWTYTVS